jgi:hypothetical protein
MVIGHNHGCSIGAVIALAFLDKGIEVEQCHTLEIRNPYPPDVKASAFFRKSPEPWQMKQRRHR